ncbi:Chimeric ERCC6-PGBD3 protein [Eumeta japonica]|uniref:Chimeric ERCC6-PGBD3 protein n=1 Tax=Eumeta variegata TaxID=151549 RepID=A0A4C1WY86_EUMVA|nr:Chimeric ERCC6-PGBD3 protein [Eumeta japonica]
MGPPDGGRPYSTIKITDWKKVSTAFEKIDTPPLNSIHDDIRTTEQIDHAIGALTSHVRTVVKRCEREVPASSDRRKFPPDILELIRAKNKALRRASAYPTPEYRARARALQREVKARVQEFRNESWSDLMEEITLSHKAFWKITKALKTEGYTAIPPLKDRTAPLPRRGSRIEEEVLQKTSLEPRDDLTPVSLSEVQLLVRSLKTRKAPGLDGVTWKEAEVIGIHKPGKPRDLPARYRPISLLSGLAKLFERVLKTRILHLGMSVLTRPKPGRSEPEFPRLRLFTLLYSAYINDIPRPSSGVRPARVINLSSSHPAAADRSRPGRRNGNRPVTVRRVRGTFLVGFSPTLPTRTGARVCGIDILPPRRKWETKRNKRSSKDFEAYCCFPASPEQPDPDLEMEVEHSTKKESNKRPAAARPSEGPTSSTSDSDTGCSDDSDHSDFTTVRRRKASRPKTATSYLTQAGDGSTYYRITPSSKKPKKANTTTKPTVSGKSTQSINDAPESWRNPLQPTKATDSRVPTAPTVTFDEADDIVPPPPLKQCDSKGIVILHGRNSIKGQKIQPASVTDYRNLSALLATFKVAYHTYSLKDEREFRVVLRGVPKEIPIEEVKEDLLTQDLPVQSAVLEHLRGKDFKITKPPAARPSRAAPSARARGHSKPVIRESDGGPRTDPPTKTNTASSENIKALMSVISIIDIGEIVVLANKFNSFRLGGFVRLIDCHYFRMPRILNENEIVDVLLEDIPSDGESVCSVEPDEEQNDDPQSLMVLGDTPPQLQPDIDDVFTSEDDVPLSNLASSSVGTPTFVEPKWKKNYRMEEPSEYTGGVSIPNYIIDLENVTPTQLFHLFWSEDLLEIISYQTNLYATQKGTRFTPTTPQEIEVFLALNLVMGVKNMPSYKDYWSSAPDLHDSYISSFISLNCFGWLLNNLHLNDNNLMPNKSDANCNGDFGYRRVSPHPGLPLLTMRTLLSMVGGFLAVWRRGQ